jgi:aminopeptidase N
LTLTQRTPPTPGQAHKQALPIPLAVALLGADGQPLPLRIDGDAAAPAHERILLLSADTATYRFLDIAQPPVASLGRGYSAPVRVAQDIDANALALQARHDSDGFNRWFAADTLARRTFARTLAQGTVDSHLLAIHAQCLGGALHDADLDPALMAEMLTFTDALSLSETLNDVDPEAVHRARARVETALARTLAKPLLAKYHALSGDATAGLAAQGRRRLRNACLAALCRADTRHLDLARTQLAQARNLTDRLAALGALVNAQADDADAALAAFAERYADSALVLDKWFALQACGTQLATLERVAALTSHAAFRWANPNNVYSLIGAFAMRNPRVFHCRDGAGYRFVAQAIERLDALTPQVSARLATAFGAWRRYEPTRRALMRHALENLAKREGNSPDLADILGRTLADSGNT